MKPQELTTEHTENRFKYKEITNKQPLSSQSSLEI
jgi:hypothetical protein